MVYFKEDDTFPRFQGGGDERGWSGINYSRVRSNIFQGVVQHFPWGSKFSRLKISIELVIFQGVPTLFPLWIRAWSSCLCVYVRVCLRACMRVYVCVREGLFTFEFFLQIKSILLVVFQSQDCHQSHVYSYNYRLKDICY